MVHAVYDLITTNSLLTKVSDSSITRRNNKFKLMKKRTYKNGYKHFFTNRIVDTWNNLPNHIADAKSINIFKNKIDSYFRDIIYDFVGE